MACPAGSVCTDPSASPVPCDTGTWSGIGEAVACEDCPAGYYCSDASQPPTVCPFGTYSEARQDSCESCPAGQSCLNPGETPQNCDSGTYSPLGNAVCLQCPAGSSCTNSSTAECSEGQYSLGGDSACHDCPAGSACPVKTQGPVACADGQHTDGLGAQTACQDCAAGMYCSDPATAPQACGAGTYSLAKATSCTDCPSGFQCPTTNQAPTVCLPGYYSAGQTTNCTACPAGYACPSQTDPSAMFECLPGTYSLGAQSSCTSCAPGKFCPDTDSDASNGDCAAGHYSFTAFARCTSCLSGWKCPSTDGSGNARCIAGTYSTGNATSCTECPAGYECPRTDSDSQVPCSAGYYSDGLQESCTACSPGYECPDTSDSNQNAQCQAGFYSVGAQQACTQCPAGFACPSVYSSFAITCYAGSYALPGSTSCTECPAGQFCNDTMTSPENCATGYYSLGGQVACTPCPPGYYCPQTDSGPIICPAGTYTNQSMTECLDCDPGYACPEGSQSRNPTDGICPQGYYCEDGTTLSVCPAGTYGNMSGATSATEGCAMCPPGYFCPAVPVVGTPGPEYQCPRGYYCPAGTTYATEYGCDGGTYGIKLMADKPEDCVACPAGRYCPLGCSDPLVCLRGHYCPAHTQNYADNPCPAGTFTEESGASAVEYCKTCPEGHYCASGIDTPTPCPQGTFNPDTGQDTVEDCDTCTAGFACTQLGLTEPDSHCQPGYYCPSGSDSPNANANACPAGSYTDYHNLTAAFQCDTCPEQFACLIGTGGQNQPPELCAQGHYCPAGTQNPSQYPCAAGSWTNQTNLAAQEECYECPRGWYCLEGSTAPTDTCATGHYCPAGTQTATQFPCHAGSYSNDRGNIRWEQCEDCTVGNYCPEGSSLPTACPAGTYRDQLEGQAVTDCSDCTAGHYCPGEGNTEPLECGRGNYSDTGAAACTTCEAGYYCDSTTTSRDVMYSDKICPAGMTCDYGRTTAPDLENDFCRTGHYCLSGDKDPFPRPCPNGTYSDEVGLIQESQCQTCPAGKWCSPPGLSAPADDCPGGHYCPEGTADPYANPCPVGYYLNASAGEDSQGCTPCISGYYCDERGLAWPKECIQGYFCVSGSTFPQPCPAGTYGNTTGLRRSEDCSPCPGGWYCDGFANTEPTDVCDPGFYCKEKAYTSAPVDGVTGGLCPPGGYCPAGSAWPANCPLGTYSNSSGSKTPDDCIACDPGYYCAGDNNPEPTGPCKPGYYCTGGAGTPTQFAVPAGHYSNSGAYKPEPCPQGQFQTANASSACAPCAQGYYCPNFGTIVPSTCLAGHYCEQQTIIPTPCPVGTTRLEEGGQSEESACISCTPGYFCNDTALTLPSGPCAAGHYCSGGTVTPFPMGNGTDNGDMCPKGFYCMEGTANPYLTPCFNGTYGNITGLTAQDDCLDCPPGEVCSGLGLMAPNELCAAGYYCKGKAKIRHPTDDVTGNICPEGFYCPEGSPAPMRCEGGYYTNITGQASCFDCPAGYYCPDGYRLLECPRGDYCLRNTGGNESLPCPRGFYNPDLGLASESQCLPCKAGFYCRGLGIWQFNSETVLEETAGPCDPGYYCLSGVDLPNPENETALGIGGPCPRGFWCPQETSVPNPCPLGTYSDQQYLTAIGECKACDLGMYCSKENLTAPEGVCSPGFYCLNGSATPTPTGSGNTGGPCPTRHYCDGISPVPQECPEGTWNNLEQQASCFDCPEGYYCPKGVASYNPYPCPAGHFCPNGTQFDTQYPCPRGTYRPNTKGMSLSDCTACDPGKYCQFEGATSYTNSCDPGYFCIRGAWTAQPDDFSNYTDGDCLCPSIATGGRCQPGYYCPQGSSEPQECTEGNYCGTDGLEDVSGPCLPGYYCDVTASREDPTDGVTGNVCPAGRYCESGTGANPPNCPTGTFSNATGLTALSECDDCTAGYYCETPGLTRPTGPCQEGYYCPSGQDIKNPMACDAGYYCEEGSPEQVECPSGTYQDESTQSSCKICNAGYYCNVADAPISDYTLYPCPIGYYCPNGTEYSTQYGCALGTYGNATMLERQDQCLDCPAGKYCDELGLSSYKGDCAAGFWCIGGSSTQTPTDGTTGVECPRGQYCKAGVVYPEDCPIGTLSDSGGLKSISGCEPCTGGSYCNGTGLTQPSGPCDPGYYCLTNATTPTPEDGGVTGDPCTAGHYCPGETTSPIPCEPGSYTTTTHRSECDECPEGSYCVTGYDPEPCPHGFYCPNGTGYDWRPCPTGSYSNQIGLKEESECTLCDPSKFCAYINATMVTGNCAAGYFCTEGSDTATPEVTFKGVAGVCPEGSYCEEGTATPSPCPRGTFGNKTKLKAESECTQCLYGMYCDAEGLTWPQGECDPGFYCLRGSQDANNPSEDATGGPCPAGHYCPRGTSFPLGCLSGTYNPLRGQSECLDCEAGFWCPENSTAADQPCPRGHYCPNGTAYATQYPCPKGYYNDFEQKSQLDDCKPCEPGYYCASPGREAVTDECAPGWYCIRGAWSDKPTDYGYGNISTNCFCPGNSTGGQCQPGEFCPRGSNYPTPCTRGYYCDSAGQHNETDLCDEGYYCTEGAWRPDPTDGVTGDLCPTGHYCPRGTYDPVPCPAGYFSNATGGTAFEDCKLCSPGFYCEDSGLDEPTAPCEAGFYCPEGQNVSRPALYQCSPGHYCPPQSIDQLGCESGTYQDEWGMVKETTFLFT
ncbi:zonadhesin-like [Acanthaster planci]|uniref:Zonadhesin-like n=1 Tax=Acanthaster planci TaxID=133434 RepID=A0A8B7Z336_ACAPL|nr:zonadhesin-like [Acanthaster planci]